MAIKNQEVIGYYWAWDTDANAYKTGDVANHTLYTVLDGVATAADNSPAEVDATNSPGMYKYTFAAAETNGNSYSLSGKSATANISLFFEPANTDRGTIASIGTQATSVGTLATSVGTAASTDTLSVGTLVSTSHSTTDASVTSVGTQVTSTGTLITSVGTSVSTSHSTTDAAVGSVGTQTTSVGTAVSTSVSLTVASTDASVIDNSDSENPVTRADIEKAVYAFIHNNMDVDETNKLLVFKDNNGDTLFTLDYSSGTDRTVS